MAGPRAEPGSKENTGYRFAEGRGSWHLILFILSIYGCYHLRRRIILIAQEWPVSEQKTSKSG